MVDIRDCVRRVRFQLERSMEGGVFMNGVEMGGEMVHLTYQVGRVGAVRCDVVCQERKMFHCVAIFFMRMRSWFRGTCGHLQREEIRGKLQ
jgi:hypothetical protein